MTKYVLSIAIFTALIYATIANQSDGDSDSNNKGYFLKYDGKDKPPADLQAAYTAFVAILLNDPSEEKIQEHCLPHSIRVTEKVRTADMLWNSTNDLNKPFLKKHFKPEVVSVRRDGDDSFMIRSWSTTFFFVLTKSAKWKVYSTRDSHLQ